MEQRSVETHDILETPRKLPEMLNVLTILTYIGCGLGYLSALWGFYGASHYEEQLDKLQEQQDKLGDSGMGKMMEGSIEMMKKTHDYRYIMLAVGLVFTTLCLIGAMQMRKLRKPGFTLYAIGELAPLVITALLIGFSFTAALSMGIGFIIAIVFVILYASQRKYLVND